VKQSQPARLIVHADDFGLSEAVNHAVIAAHEHGIVTATSLMAGGDAFEHAVTLAKASPTLDVGVHLTLTEQRPVAALARVRSLIGATGSFAPHATQFAKRYARGEISLDDVRNELDAQIGRVVDHGIAPSHLDGHQHVHVLPGIARVVVDLARKYGIAAVRSPAERLRGYMLQDLAGVKRVIEQLVLGALSRLSPLRTLRRTDGFVGFYFGGRLDERNLRIVLDHLPEGRTVELMCHPGLEDPESRFGHWNYDWAAESAALSSPAIKALLAARGVQLIGYREA
jgi:hopanoid biosynthesis associated protein HpnK